jgi:hypothetical protein
MGAALGGAATAAAEGPRTGTAYSVELLNGSTIRIISDQREIRVGDCVAIERVGETSNIRREPATYCASGNPQMNPSMQREAEAAASRCEAAKEELVRASTPDAADTATRKINTLCN